MRRSILAMALLCVAGTAGARECAKVSFPDQVQVGGTQLAVNGLGMRKATFLKVDVYVAALYAASPSQEARALVESPGPQVLVLHFVRNVGVDDLTKAWREGFEKNARTALPALQERIATLNGWMTDMKSGQQLRFTRRPGAGVEVEVAGAVKGTIPGEDFARDFVAIWLGDKPPNPDLKRGLLGGACS